MKHIVYPKLRRAMSEKNDDVKNLCVLLDMSQSTAREKLRGIRDFTLKESIILSARYNMGIIELFAK